MQRPFIQWMNKNSTEVPKSMHDYYDNLNDPIEYIKNAKINKLIYDRDKTYEQFKKNKDTIAQFSKSVYKKVISSDNVQYTFGASNLENNSKNYSVQWDKTTGNIDMARNTPRKLERRMEDKPYQFYKQKKKGNDKKTFQLEKQEPLTFKQIKTIDTQQFNLHHKNVQFYDVFCSESHLDKNPGSIFKFNENQAIQKCLQFLKFNLQQNQNFVTHKSEQIPFHIPKQMKYWKNKVSRNSNDQQINILSCCINLNLDKPNYLDLLDIAFGKYSTEEIVAFKKLKKNHEVKKKMQENSELLQKKYIQIKDQLQKLKQNKMKNKGHHRVPIKYTDNHTQTLNQLKLKQLQQDGQINTIQDLILEVKQLKKIREEVLMRQDKKTRNIMIVNLNEQIRNMLFKLLLYIFDSQSTPQYTQFVDIDKQVDAQRKFLDIIYQKYSKFANETVQNTPKLKLLEFYIEQRKTCQQFMEIINQRWNDY